jgi:hypothetical protein
MLGSTNFRTCNPDDYCTMLKKYLRQDDGTRHKGLAVYEMADATDPDWSGTAIVYHASHRDKGIILNFCPFCGARIFLTPDETVPWLPSVLTKRGVT